MNLEQHWCDNASCREFGRVQAGNIKVFSYREQRYYCTTCGRTFSADKGTFFETLRSDHQMITDVLAWLMERNSLRAVERRAHHPHDTILHWVDLAGQHAAQVSHAVIHDLHVTQAQVDELWTFVKKSKNTCNPLIHPIKGICGCGARLPSPVDCGSSVI